MMYRLDPEGTFLPVPQVGNRPLVSLTLAGPKIHLVEVRVPAPDGPGIEGGTPWLRGRSEAMDGGAFRLLIRPSETHGPGEYLAVVRLGGKKLGILLRVPGEPVSGSLPSRRVGYLPITLAVMVSVAILLAALQARAPRSGSPVAETAAIMPTPAPLATDAKAAQKEPARLLPGSARPLESIATGNENPYLVVAGSFKRPENAMKETDRVRQAGYSGAAGVPSDDYPGLSPGWWIVLVGRFSDRPEADRVAADLAGRGFSVRVAISRLSAKAAPPAHRPSAGPDRRSRPRPQAHESAKPSLERKTRNSAAPRARPSATAPGVRTATQPPRLPSPTGGGRTPLHERVAVMPLHVEAPASIPGPPAPSARAQNAEPVVVHTSDGILETARAAESQANRLWETVRNEPLRPDGMERPSWRITRPRGGHPR
ncbi:MAG: SPOR domain-containing protein [Armatimonadetes bacterium]|nr:SPOR domain-containing protein [Armatimonadota bacterium]